MKKKKYIFILSIIILLIVIFFLITKINLIKSNIVLPPAKTQNLEYGYPSLNCIEYDRNGVCSLYMNMMNNATYTISIS